ncbi:MAG: hypothetical protein DWP97_08490 [Calditrichaeota bacterium]|nr:MAG: hypothetical protein DWP97_08490 [Calditrichota bacterium]
MRKVTTVILFLLMLFVMQSIHAVDKAHLRWMRDKPMIDSIVINGNNSISNDDIRGRMYSKTESLWRKIKKDRRIRVQRETLNRDTLEIKYLYLTRGFINVQVGETFQPLDQFDIVKNENTGIVDTVPKAMLWVNIYEGIKYSYGKKTFSGTYPNQFYLPLLKLANKLETGKDANMIKLQQIIFEMKTEFANHGYPYSKIEYQIDTVTNEPDVDINFVVQADSLVKFGDIFISGIEIFPDNVAKRELKIKSGDLYSRKAIIESQKRLYESGYFTFSQLTQATPLNDRLNPDFQLKVREKKPKFVTATAGVGQSSVKDLQLDASLGAGKRDVNFTPIHFPKFSKASHRVSANADYSFSVGGDSRLIKHKYSLRYTSPWTVGLRMPLTLTAEWEPPIQSQLGDYRIRKWAFTAGTQKWFGDEIRTTAGVEYNNVKITGYGDNDVQEIREQEGISARRKLYTTFRLDSRDNIFIPRVGQLTELSVDIFGGFLGGEDNFYKVQLAWSTYQPVWPGWIYALRLKGGTAREYGVSKTVPIEERIYLGGANTIRGFTENTLGPLNEDSTAAGANYTFIINQEFRWKTVQFLNVFGDFFRNFPQWQSIFFDAGNGFENSAEIKFDNFALSYGTGIQIMSPAGPIRIDYARRIKTDRYPVDSRWHFTILYAF